MSDQDIQQVCDFTNASREEASRFLKLADNNVEDAISLLLEGGIDFGVGDSGSEVVQPSTTSPVDERNRILTDEELARQFQEHDEGAFQDIDDEEVARRFQEQDNVRAPIAPTNDILDGGAGSFYTHSRNHVPNPPSIFSQGDSTNPHGLTGDSSATSKASRLEFLFRPPYDIMFTGTFEDAREHAKKTGKKWLIVDIQDPSEFVCQVLKRDIWSDPDIKNIIKESFIFVQYDKESTEGKRYRTFYIMDKYPHIAIIDALTGEQVKVLEECLTPAYFLSETSEYYKSTPSRANKTVTKPPQVSKPLSEMSEEEQLNAAIAASLGGGSPSNSSQPTALDIEVENEDNLQSNEKKRQVEEMEEQQEPEKAGSAFDGIKAVEREETKDIANSTRIQLKMPNGERIVRRFEMTDPVRYIFEFAKVCLKGNPQPFELVFNRTQLIDVIDQSIKEAKLSNVAVNCAFI